ncbi:redoxin family protein [Natronobacterium texcoconense]|uniref:Redoxin n=1 Tax=Natronobacterium texcoconense TaxID=1095778 RepID=A0A1H1AW27_NATTX|nr:redoxin family protein [Natronobacterium texcoconense]SDQ43731.1 Redoxin [Natronobacterium texcoconense]
MRRREVLVGAAAAAVAGAGAAVTLGDWDPLEDGDGVPEFELEGIDAPGSNAGTVVVPERGTVTFLEVFTTPCGVCSDMMAPLGEVYDDVGDEVQFVSVTNEPLGRTTTADDVADWWADHDGRWQVAHDDDLEFTRELDATGTPYSLVLNEENAVIWSDRGFKTADELREQIETALGSE